MTITNQPNSYGKIALLFFIALAEIKTMATDMDGFKNLDAPSVSGAYTIPWLPSGPTDQGYIYGIGFNLLNGDETLPSILWIKKGSKDSVEVRSMESIDAVATVLSSASPSTSEAEAAALMRCRFIARTMSMRGRTGFCLDRILNPSMDLILKNLRSLGLSEQSVGKLRSISGDSVFRLDVQRNEWYRSWFEVDRSGVIEKVRVAGTFHPFRTTTVLHEVMTSMSEVPTALLLSERLLHRDD